MSTCDVVPGTLPTTRSRPIARRSRTVWFSNSIRGLMPSASIAMIRRLGMLSSVPSSTVTPTRSRIGLAQSSQLIDTRSRSPSENLSGSARLSAAPTSTIVSTSPCALLPERNASATLAPSGESAMSRTRVGRSSSSTLCGAANTGPAPSMASSSAGPDLNGKWDLPVSVGRGQLGKIPETLRPDLLLLERRILRSELLLLHRDLRLPPALGVEIEAYAPAAVLRCRTHRLGTGRLVHDYAGWQPPLLPLFVGCGCVEPLEPGGHGQTAARREAVRLLQVGTLSGQALVADRHGLGPPVTHAEAPMHELGDGGVR